MVVIVSFALSLKPLLKESYPYLEKSKWADQKYDKFLIQIILIY